MPLGKRHKWCVSPTCVWLGLLKEEPPTLTTSKAIVAAIIVGLFNLTILASFRHQIPLIFTDDPEVASIVGQVMLVCAGMQIFDSLAAVSNGILRGIGRQAIGGYANLFSYYFVALPISLSTAFCLGWKLGGLWVGMTSGIAAEVPISKVSTTSNERTVC